MMNKLMIRFVFVSMMIGMFALASFAQSNNKRVQFAKGKKSAVEKFTIPAEDGITYILGLKQWQLMKFTVSELYSNKTEAQGLEIKLTKLGEDDEVLAEASAGEEVEYQFTGGGGDYVITVMNPGRKKANITLNVSINK